jgi:predicted SAM-dependent methyltransferase
MKLLNLGCGTHYHQSWTNVNFVSTGDGVIPHNLLQGIPFGNESFDVIYHSHVLEHFTKEDGANFIKECYRVLKPNGVLRIAVPDLEQIARNYIHFLDKAIEGDQEAIHNYNWTLIELYDQTVREYSGGAMGAYLKSDMPNADFVYSRLGRSETTSTNKYKTPKPSPLRFINPKSYLRVLKRMLMTEEEKKALAIGKFRMQGEVHLQMYDRFSLHQLLTAVGFSKTMLQEASTSNIENWNSYQLDANSTGAVRKPDSLFMEAIK